MSAFVFHPFEFSHFGCSLSISMNLMEFRVPICMAFCGVSKFKAI